MAGPGEKTSMELKAALVGCGAMSRAWLQAAARIPDLRIVGLADLDGTRAKERAAEFSLKDPVVAGDVHVLIEESRPDLLFDIVVPSARHEVVSAGRCQGNGGSSTCSATAISRATIYSTRARHSAKAAERLCL
jgi:hypothetical protein